MKRGGQRGTPCPPHPCIVGAPQRREISSRALSYTSIISSSRTSSKTDPATWWQATNSPMCISAAIMTCAHFLSMSASFVFGKAAIIANDVGDSNGAIATICKSRYNVGTMGKFTSNLRQRLLKRLTRRHHDLDRVACLGCGVKLDSAQYSDSDDAEDVKPHEGAISVCFQCGHIAAFDHNLRFRPLTDDEIVEIAGDPEIVLIGNIRGPMRDLMHTYKTLSEEEVQRRIAFLVEQINKAERRKHAGR